MDEGPELIRRVRAALPAMRVWVIELVESTRAEARPVSSAGHRRLARHFPADLLDSARFVVVPRAPLPPLRAMGLAEFEGRMPGKVAGITFGDTFFVTDAGSTESVFAHELVHVLQWRRLGFERFLLAYALGLARHGYEQSPLERIAYAIQQRFDEQRMPEDVVALVNARTDAV